MTLRRARFGRSSDKLDRDIEQLELLIGDLEEEATRARRSSHPSFQRYREGWRNQTTILSAVDKAAPSGTELFRASGE
jgi:hypothetical protein